MPGPCTQHPRVFLKDEHLIVLRHTQKPHATTERRPPCRDKNVLAGGHRPQTVDLPAAKTYVSTRGMRGSLTSTYTGTVKDALGEGPPALQIGTEDLRAVALCQGGSPASLRRHPPRRDRRDQSGGLRSAHRPPCLLHTAGRTLAADLATSCPPPCTTPFQQMRCRHRRVASGVSVCGRREAAT